MFCYEDLMKQFAAGVSSKAPTLVLVFILLTFRYATRLVLVRPLCFGTQLPAKVMTNPSDKGGGEGDQIL